MIHLGQSLALAARGVTVDPDHSCNRCYCNIIIIMDFYPSITIIWRTNHFSHVLYSPTAEIQFIELQLLKLLKKIVACLRSVFALFLLCF